MSDEYYMYSASDVRCLAHDSQLAVVRNTLTGYQVVRNGCWFWLAALVGIFNIGYAIFVSPIGLRIPAAPIEDYGDSS